MVINCLKLIFFCLIFFYLDSMALAAQCTGKIRLKTKDGTLEYDHLQTAIDEATPESFISVSVENIPEKIIISSKKNIEIFSTCESTISSLIIENSETIGFEGFNISSDEIEIVKIEHSSDISIANSIIQGRQSSSTGIKVGPKSSHINIIRNTIKESNVGIRVETGTEKLQLDSNKIINNKHQGIYVKKDSTLNLSGNIIKDNGDSGIHLEQNIAIKATTNQITSNGFAMKKSSQKGYGVYFDNKLEGSNITFVNNKIFENNGKVVKDVSSKDIHNFILFDEDDKLNSTSSGNETTNMNDSSTSGYSKVTDDVEVFVEPGSLPENFTIDKITAGSKAPSEVVPPALLKTTKAIGDGITFGPSNTIFTKPIIVIVNYDKSLIPVNKSEKDLQLMYYNTNSKKLERVAEAGFFAGKLYAKIDHFSYYFYVLSPDPPQPPINQDLYRTYGNKTPPSFGYSFSGWPYFKKLSNEKTCKDIKLVDTNLENYISSNSTLFSFSLGADKFEDSFNDKFPSAYFAMPSWLRDALKILGLSFSNIRNFALKVVGPLSDLLSAAQVVDIKDNCHSLNKCNYLNLSRSLDNCASDFKTNLLTNCFDTIVVGKLAAEAINYVIKQSGLKGDVAKALDFILSGIVAYFRNTTQWPYILSGSVQCGGQAALVVNNLDKGVYQGDRRHQIAFNQHEDEVRTTPKCSPKMDTISKDLYENIPHTFKLDIVAPGSSQGGYSNLGYYPKSDYFKIDGPYRSYPNNPPKVNIYKVAGYNTQWAFNYAPEKNKDSFHFIIKNTTTGLTGQCDMAFTTIMLEDVKIPFRVSCKSGNRTVSGNRWCHSDLICVDLNKEGIFYKKPELYQTIRYPNGFCEISQEPTTGNPKKWCIRAVAKSEDKLGGGGGYTECWGNIHIKKYQDNPYVPSFKVQ